MPTTIEEAQRLVNYAGQDPAADDRCISFVMARWSELKPAPTPWEGKWADVTRAYEMLPVRRYYNGRARLVSNRIFVLTERLSPRVRTITVGRGEFFDALPGAPDLEDKCEVNKGLVRKRMETDLFRAKGRGDRPGDGHPGEPRVLLVTGPGDHRHPGGNRAGVCAVSACAGGHPGDAQPGELDAPCRR